MTLHDFLDNWLLRGRYEVLETMVVGPYITADFFESLIGYTRSTVKAYPHVSLTVLADDGWDGAQLQKIETLYAQSKGRTKRTVEIHRVAAEQGSGLVHVKLIHFVLSSIERNSTKHVLLLGSANTSRQGFGTHAESFISIDMSYLKTDSKAAVGNYLSSLKRGEDVSEVEFSLTQGSRVSLPALRIVEERISGFDAWLRRGTLCYKYQPDPSFGRLKLKLKKSLPKTDLESPFNNVGFGSESDLSEFNREYIRNQNTSDELSKKASWREKFFVETYFGFWTSEDCFADFKNDFVEPNAEQRRSIIDAIQNASVQQQEKWLDDFSSAILEVGRVAGLSSEEQENDIFSTYFETDDLGNVDIKWYRLKALEKLKIDHRQALDLGFSSRFTSGYSFSRTPRLDGDDFEKFAINWAETVLTKLNKSRLRNHLIVGIRSAISNGVALRQESAEIFLKSLRAHWDEAQEYIIGFHRESEAQ